MFFSKQEDWSRARDPRISQRRKDCQRGLELEELQSFAPRIFFLFVVGVFYWGAGGQKCFKLQLSLYRKSETKGQVSDISGAQYQVQRVAAAADADLGSVSRSDLRFRVSKSAKCRNKRTPVLVEEAVFKFCRAKCKNIECLLQLGRS